MPDLRPARRFERQMVQLEEDYSKALRGLARPTRLALVEAAVTGGITGLAAIFRRLLDDLRRQARLAAGEQAGRLETPAETMARAQFGLIRSEFGRQIVDATAEERRAVLSGLADSSTGWIDRLEIALEAGLWRLRTAGENDRAVVDQLLATDLQSGRASAWRMATVDMGREAQSNLWLAGIGLLGSYYRAGESQAGRQWQKQAVAAIDERTTDCCLRVHGQVQPLKTPFHLTGTPRFADRMQHPPFHRYCRTVETVYAAEMEAVGETTAEMRDAARAEIEARERTGKRAEIHPASATSRRRN